MQEQDQHCLCKPGWRRSRRPSSKPAQEKPPARMGSLQKSIRLQDQQPLTPSTASSTAYGRKRTFPRSSETPQSSPFTKRRAANLTVATTGAITPVYCWVYKTVVLTSLLYGCETWTLYRRHIKLLERFHMRSLRSILGIKWQDMITNLEVLDRAETTSIEAMILKAQLRWTGHIIRMDSDRIPKQLLYGVLSKGKRKQGRPLKRFKDCIKANIAYTGIATKQLEECAQDHTGWRALTREATKAFEAHRRANVTEARAKRKAAGETPKPPGQFPCSHCGRV
ncbi:hypothetical protein AWC38_SpisGene13414 [Stylophora pistillata]|uniref:Uncharacterized protein n=1 Tax=Stylophora pistillata TaxID=50429 RepID=A0A2B4S0P1_STYPI|nr:hypothetical protein AWC38_SpisGene13414 [Stylophora pistillata]